MSSSGEAWHAMCRIGKHQSGVNPVSLVPNVRSSNHSESSTSSSLQEEESIIVVNLTEG